MSSLSCSGDGSDGPDRPTEFEKLLASERKRN